MVDLASDSDAIRGRYAEAKLVISPSGLVEADHAFRAEIANPYVLESFGVGFRAAAETYESLYRKRGEKGEPDALHLEEPEFAAAFLAEYGLAPSRLIDILAEFIDFARVGWVEEHLAEAWKRLGLPHPNFSVSPLLVTNADVPSQFKRDLPLRPEQVIPLRVLAERLAR